MKIVQRFDVLGFGLLMLAVAIFATAVLISEAASLQWLDKWQGLIGSLLGGTFTIGAGAIAYYAAMRQLDAAKLQIQLALRIAEEAKIEALFTTRNRLQRDLDCLRTAEGYLRGLAAPFPENSIPPNEMNWLTVMRQSRLKAFDFSSSTANAAPEGIGSRIETVIARLQRLGDRIEERINATNVQSAANYYAPIIAEAIIGIRTITDQIHDAIPEYERRLVGAIAEIGSLELAHDRADRDATVD